MILVAKLSDTMARKGGEVLWIVMVSFEKTSEQIVTVDGEVVRVAVASLSNLTEGRVGTVRVRSIDRGMVVKFAGINVYGERYCT